MDSLIKKSLNIIALIMLLFILLPVSAFGQIEPVSPYMIKLTEPDSGQIECSEMNGAAIVVYRHFCSFIRFREEIILVQNRLGNYKKISPVKIQSPNSQNRRNILRLFCLAFLCPSHESF